MCPIAIRQLILIGTSFSRQIRRQQVLMLLLLSRPRKQCRESNTTSSTPKTSETAAAAFLHSLFSVLSLKKILRENDFSAFFFFPRRRSFFCGHLWQPLRPTSKQTEINYFSILPVATHKVVHTHKQEKMFFESASRFKVLRYMLRSVGNQQKTGAQSCTVRLSRRGMAHIDTHTHT